ncbi:PREDICTED: coiled-coil domain-containing protein 22 homolog [Amphimedon queenslandica]|uniref:CCDC22 N-terminal domain-containing protein n=1 Tax=Amphimedon queenslandica TaxID=400682 RepID=A0AAN0JW74_AMPQE|nr:PREDICTED: coiled-coil domain-containing protein 22 homolog [Amphimedon queenslandica]|eukprot:XP_019861423.1 PREDICTED: coiled-coil domain-containing protein 22 homolog [Amphimedon queenslandica]
MKFAKRSRWSIIISTLKEVGCDFEDEIASLTQFTPEMVVEASVRCLQIIIPEFQSPTHLPDAMSARFRMCTGLANACQELGFQAEVGYQTFLYSSVKDWRKLLMFLLEKLPKEAAQTADEPTGAGILLTRSIGAEIGASLRTPWTPSYCKRESVRRVRRKYPKK